VKRPILTLCLMALHASAFAASQGPEPADSLLESWYKQHLAGAQARFVGSAAADRRSDPAIDVLHGRLELTPDLGTGHLTGRAELHLRSLEDGLSVVELDLAQAITVDSVGGDLGGFTRMGDALRLELSRPVDTGETLEAVIHYSGLPAATGFGSWTLSSHAGVPALSTLSEPYGARSWWPCKDDPTDKLDSLRIVITVPFGFTATSNGVLEQVEELGATRRFTWFEKHPIATYLVSLCVTNYVSFSHEYTGLEGQAMDVVHYVYPEDLADAQVDFDVTVPMLEFFAGLWGEYPFVDEKYGHSQFSWGGGMEHQCNTSYGSALIRGDHLYDRIVAHELAHQWWGNLITCATFDDIWLNEGFATYSEALWAEHIGGSAGLQSYMTSRAWVTDPSGPIYAPTNTFSSNTVYRKGAWLLHMLRGIIGDEPFRQLMRGWYQSPHRYGSATVAQFVEHASQYTDRELAGFWNGYLYGVNRPSYRSVMVPRLHQGHHLAQVAISQIQTNAPLFDMYLPLRVNSTSGPAESVIRHRSAHLGTALVLPDPPTALLIDPDNWVLKYTSAGTLGSQVAQVVFSVRHKDGSEPGAGGVSASLYPAGQRDQGLVVSSLEHGIVVVDLKNELPGWMPGDPLDLVLEALEHEHAGELASVPLAPGGAAWQDLGVFDLTTPAPPALAIEQTGETLNLSWSAVEGAVAYRIYRADTLAFQEEQLVAETAGLQWQTVAQPGSALFRVKAVW
jgi:aminopeptidase N